LLDDDVTHTAVDQDVNLEQGRALDALTERGRGIARAYLVAALWACAPGYGARGCLSTRRRGHRRRGRRGRPTRALDRRGRGGRAGRTRAQRGGFAGRPPRAPGPRGPRPRPRPRRRARGPPRGGPAPPRPGGGAGCVKGSVGSGRWEESRGAGFGTGFLTRGSAGGASDTGVTSSARSTGGFRSSARTQCSAASTPAMSPAWRRQETPTPMERQRDRLLSISTERFRRRHGRPLGRSTGRAHRR